MGGGGRPAGWTGGAAAAGPDEPRRARRWKPRPACATWTRFTRRAYELLASPASRDAFDVTREPQKVRDAYGPTPFGQNCLLARRLVEAGVPMVTVYSFGNRDWDTHGDNFKTLKNTLLPPTDRGLSALLEDLDSRGLLDETLVVWMGDMGRTPRINKARRPRSLVVLLFRSCWPAAASAAARCTAPPIAARPTRPPTRSVPPTSPPPSITAWASIPGHVTDQQGRPLVVGTGKPIQAVLG